VRPRPKPAAMSSTTSSVGQSQSRRYRSIRRVVVPTRIVIKVRKPGWSETTRNKSTETTGFGSCRFAAFPNALGAFDIPVSSFIGRHCAATLARARIDQQWCGIVHS